VFLENGVNLTGIETGFGGAWSTATPKLIFVPDRDGDDRPDGPDEVLLDDGHILQGGVETENPLQLTLRIATDEVVVPLDSIEPREGSSLSRMPEGTLEHLTAEQRRDLIAYLHSPSGEVNSL